MLLLLLLSSSSLLLLLLLLLLLMMMMLFLLLLLLIVSYMHALKSFSTQKERAKEKKKQIKLICDEAVSICVYNFCCLF